MAKAGTYLAVIVALAGAVFLMAFAFPYLFDATQTHQDITILQDGGQTYTISGDIQTTASEITNSDVNVTLETDETVAEANIAEGSTESLTVNGDEVNVTVNSASNADDQAEIAYEHAPFAGYPDAVAALGQYTPLLLILLGMLTVFGLLLKVA